MMGSSPNVCCKEGRIFRVLYVLLCLDEITIKNSYPDFKISEMFVQLSIKKYFVRVVLKSDYHQIRFERHLFCWPHLLVNTDTSSALSYRSNCSMRKQSSWNIWTKYLNKELLIILFLSQSISWFIAKSCMLTCTMTKLFSNNLEKKSWWKNCLSASFHYAQ